MEGPLQVYVIPIHMEPFIPSNSLPSTFATINLGEHLMENDTLNWDNLKIRQVHMTKRMS